MPTHVGPYGAARYPGTLLGAIPGYYSPTQGYIASSESNHLTERNIFSGNLNLYQPPLDLPVWPRSMPTEDELGTSPTSRLTGLGTPPNGFASSGPPSPAHSDSDASNSSLELSSSDRGDNGPRQCRWLGCERWFSSIKQLAEHLEKVHAVARRDKLFYCGWEDCNRGHRGFNAKYKMLVHVRTHTKEKPHHCLECGKGFSRRENLKIHERSHTGERPYVCNIEGCGKRYSNSSDRFKHTRTHSVDKPYCCKQPGCSKRYTDPSSLRKHVKTYRHNVNNNDKAQEKSFDENNSSQEPKFDTSPEKRSSTDSDKKDSSLESTITTTSSSSLSPLTSHSFEEQRKFVEWNNMYNLQSRQEVEQITPPKNYDQEVKHFPRIYDDSFRTPDRFNPIYPSHAIKERPVSHSPSHTSLHMSENLVRIPMQSTPIKREEIECPPKATVDYRNIDSIVNSTPCKKENPIRHSVIKRADNVIKMDTSESPKINDDSKEACCCRHTCCIHNNNLSEKAKLLSDLLMNTQNPLFKQLLGSVDLRSELQNMWSSHVDRENVGQDLRIKSHESMTEMEQDLPLDLTSHK